MPKTVRVLGRRCLPRLDRSAEYLQRLEDDDALRRAFRRPVYKDLTDYLAAFPQEHIRLIPSATPGSYAFIPALFDNRYGTLPGGYYLAKICGWDGTHWVGVYDNDDCSVVRDVPSEFAGRKLIEELCGLAPVDMPDLVEAWGFRYD